MASLTFAHDSPEGQALFQWWSDLQDQRGNRALLRRCGRLVEVVFVPTYHHLRLSLLPFGATGYTGLAVVAGVLSHVRQHAGDHRFAEQMAGAGKEGEDAPVSGLRFRRLLQRRNHDELFPALIRTVRLMDGTAHIYSLANAIYWWNDRVRKEWAFDYYAKAPEQP